MTQDEWLFKLVNIKKKEIKGKVGGERPDGTGFDLNLRYPVQPNIKDLTSAERKQIIEKMENYWKEHRPSSLEFLVNGAVVNCDQGSAASKVKDHGVYTDVSESQALLNEEDKKLEEREGTVFGRCALEPGKNPKCSIKNFLGWYGVNAKVEIGKGKSSLTMSSYLCCSKHRGACIKPITSGQEFTFSNSLF